MVFEQPREMLLGQAIMHCARINKQLTDSYDCRDTWRNTYNARVYWMRPKSTWKFFDSNTASIDWYYMLTPKRAVVCEGDLETPELETLKSGLFPSPLSVSIKFAVKQTHDRTYSPFQNYRRVPRQKPLCQHLYHIKSVITLCIIFSKLGICYPIL